MDLENVGTVVATRRLSIVGDDKQIVVNVGMPQQFPNSSDYFVPFQVVGAGSERILCAAGVDSIQAIQQVMLVIGAKLQALNEQYGGRLPTTCECGDKQ
jgi:microcompartment protein CcmK/EutM